MQAVDGTKIAANAAGDQTWDALKLERLLARTDAAFEELEAQNEGGDDLPPPRLPTELQRAQTLRERIQQAMACLAEDKRRTRVNPTDEDAQRINRRRIHGWRMPEGTVYVGRPSAWGNLYYFPPYATREERAETLRRYITRSRELGYRRRPKILPRKLR